MIKIIYRFVIFFSVAINAFLINEFIPLINHYESYWELKHWVRKNILRKVTVDFHKVYTSNKYTINPISFSSNESKFNFKDIIKNNELIGYQNLLKEQLIKNFSLNKIKNSDLNIKVDSVF